LEQTTVSIATNIYPVPILRGYEPTKASPLAISKQLFHFTLKTLATRILLFPIPPSSSQLQTPSTIAA